MPEMAVLDSVLLFFRILAICIASFFKALLPQGVLPRKSVRGQIVLVTGAGSGIGRLCALEFAKLGATVVLWDVNQKGNEETRQRIEKSGGQARAYTVDLSQREEIYQVAGAVKHEVGDVHILVNNAGVVSGKSLLECSDQQIQLTMDVNATAHIWTTRAFLPAMLEKNSGHIVTIASIAGKIGAPQMVDYCASKFAAVGFHEALTAELEATNVSGLRTTVVCPYFIDTGMFDGFKILKTSLLPPLTPDYVVQCIMEAVLTDAREVIIPKGCYILAAAPSILPSAIPRLIGQSLGIADCMKDFKGRQTK